MTSWIHFQVISPIIKWKRLVMLDARKGLELSKKGFDSIGYNTPLGTEFEEFCKNDSIKEVGEDMANDYWKSYNPHDEWKLLESEKTNPTKGCQVGIGNYELILTDEDYDWMMD
ncbi:hypothetical protein Tco_0854592 [Tanacetum coccineum]